MRYITPQEAAVKWGISRRRVNLLCAQGRIEGAERHGGIWLIPAQATKPVDRRLKKERYTKKQSPAFSGHAGKLEPAGSLPLARPVQPIPQPPENAVYRPRLLAKIAPPGKKLTFIHADAGYGKTTLLAQYAKGRTDLCWLSMESNDGDLPAFLGYLEDTIRTKLPQVEFHSSEYQAFAGNEKLIPLALSALLRAIGPVPLTFILDDVHLITDEMVIAFLVEWVKRCPDNITLVMAGRHELWSGLYRLKLEGAIAEVTKEDLCFNKEEAAALWGFFDEEAYAATEGWALAIRSYGMTAASGGSIALSKGEADRGLYRYLLHELLLRLPAELQYFLKATAWLTELDAESCNRLLGIENAQAILEELMHRNLFTLRVSATAYRYHALFRAFLRQNDDGIGRAILRKAMQNCFAQGDYERAADYALLLDDAGFIHDCISAALGRPFGGGRYRSLKKYFDCLERHRTELSSRVLLAKGMYLSSQGDFHRAEECLLEALPRLDGQDKLVWLYAMTHRARVLRNKVSLEESSRCLDEVLPHLHGEPMNVWYTVIIEKIHNLTMMSQLSAAYDLTVSMIERCAASGELRVKAWFERYLTMIYFFTGDYRKTLQAYEASLAIPEEEQEWLLRHGVGLYAAKAYQAVGENEKAVALIEAELERLHQLGLHEELCLHYIFYAEILYAAEAQKIYRGETPGFTAFSHYLHLAEEHAAINQQTKVYLLVVKILKLCVYCFSQPEKVESVLTEIMPMLDQIPPFFQTLAYGRMAGVLNTLGHDAELCKEYYERCIRIGETIGSFNLPTVAYGEAAAVYLRAGDENTAEEYTRRFMELAQATGIRYCFRNTQLIGPVLRLALNRNITPEFTRQMLAYGQIKIPRVYIHTLGQFYLASVDDRKRPVKIRIRKAKELLAYLLDHKNGVPRERILADLWGESEADVVNTFHTRRGEIRRVFEQLGAGNPILHENGVYRLCLDEIVSDRESFEEAAAAFRQDPTLEKACRVVELYDGRYLDNLEALWAEGVRLRFEEAFISAAELLLKEYAKSGDRAKTVELLRKCAVLGHRVEHG